MEIGKCYKIRIFFFSFSFFLMVGNHLPVSHHSRQIPPKGNHFSDFCGHRFILPILELSRNGIVKYVLSLLLLNILFVRFIYIIVCNFS